MSTAALVRIEGIERVNRLMARLAGVADRSDMLERAAAMVESQTRRRISDEKASPDGTPWAPWSDGYAATRHGGQSLLQAEGYLMDIMTYSIGLGAHAAYVGSNMIYAAIQQHGGTAQMAPGPAAVPARPYLGISDENLGDIEADLAAWADDLLETFQ